MSLLVGMCAAGAAGAARTVSLAYVTSATDETDLTTYTFASTALGDASVDRQIVVGVIVRRGATFSISSVSVGGVSATAVATSNNTAAGQTTAALYIAAVPTGTTGNIVVTLSAAALRCGVIVYRMTGQSSTTATVTGTSTADDPTTSLTIPVGGVGVGACTTGVIAPNASWTGLTEDADTVLGTAATMTAASRTSNAGVTATVTCDFATASVSSGAFASWG